MKQPTVKLTVTDSSVYLLTIANKIALRTTNKRICEHYYNLFTDESYTGNYWIEPLEPYTHANSSSSSDSSSNL